MLKLDRGRFRPPRSEARNGRQHFAALVQVTRRGAAPEMGRRWSPRMGLVPEPESIRVQDLGFRWESCGAAGIVNFHWASILLLPRIVDYVIIHELVHLSVRGHGPRFWRLVERAMPDYGDRKDGLARHEASIMSLV